MLDTFAYWIDAGQGPVDELLVVKRNEGLFGVSIMKQKTPVIVALRAINMMPNEVDEGHGGGDSTWSEVVLDRLYDVMKGAAREERVFVEELVNTVLQSRGIWIIPPRPRRPGILHVPRWHRRPD